MADRATESPPDDRFIKGDGCVVGMAFLPRSGARPDVVSIRTKVASGKFRATGISVENVDFREAYERAVHVFADMHEIDRADPLRTRLLDTRESFMKKYGLTTRTVCYEQVVRL
jgi:hypothetical protein